VSLAFYSTLNCHGAFLSSWSSPFIFSFSLAVYSILNCHGASFSVVLALYIILFLFPLAFYSTLNCHGIFFFLSLHPLYCIFSLASLLSTVMAHPFTSDFSIVLYILFCFTVTGLLLYSQLSWHNFVCLLHNLCISSTQFIFLKFDLSKSILLFFPLTTNFNFTFILFIIIPHKTPPTCPPCTFLLFFCAVHFCRACMSFWSNFDSLVSRTIPTGITYRVNFR
jgi:hypothetical protein